MKTSLAEPPSDPRWLDLWLQHAAGNILLRDVRDYAASRIDSAADPATKASVLKGIDDALYG